MGCNSLMLSAHLTLALRTALPSALALAIAFPRVKLLVPAILSITFAAAPPPQSVPYLSAAPLRNIKVTFVVVVQLGGVESPLPDEVPSCVEAAFPTCTKEGVAWFTWGMHS